MICSGTEPKALPHLGAPETTFCPFKQSPRWMLGAKPEETCQFCGISTCAAHGIEYTAACTSKMSLQEFELQTITMHFDRARQWIVPGCSNFPDFAVLHDILLWPRLNRNISPFTRNWKHKMLLFPMPSGGPCLNNDLPQHLFLTGTNDPRCSRGLNRLNKSQ